MFRASQATGIGVSDLMEKVVDFGSPMRHAHGSGYLPDAHHPQVHALNSHTGTADDINAWAQASAGGGAAGVKIGVGTTDPGASAAEGDIWVKK